MIKQYDEIVDLKSRIFNATLLFGTILGTVTFALSLRNYYESEIRLNYLLNLFTIITLLTVYIFRNRLSQSVKSIVVISGLFILSFVDIYKLGAYSTTKVLLVLIPLFSSIAFNYKRIILISLVAILFYLYFAFRFITGSLVTTIDLNIRSTNLSSWLVNLTLIIIVTYAVLTIINQFNKAFYKLINNLEEQNTELQAHRENLEGLVAERSADLEAANEELTTINDELNQSNIIIETQNLQLKSTLEHLKETQAKLVQSEKMASLGVLSAGVAHEINNPLNFIMGGYVGLESYFNAPNESKRNNIPIYLGSIKTGLKQASDIVQALGIFSRGNLSYSEKCDIHSIIDGCLMKLSNQYNDRIEISKEYCSESATTTGNVSMLNQVFLNILTNSIHAIDKNGKISIKTSVKIESIIVEISDSGCGISNESLQKITDPFFTTKDPGKGVGLGLSIAYTIIMEHNGEIDFKSEIGKGTTAIVKIPVKHNTQDEN